MVQQKVEVFEGDQIVEIKIGIEANQGSNSEVIIGGRRLNVSFVKKWVTPKDFVPRRIKGI